MSDWSGTPPPPPPPGGTPPPPQGAGGGFQAAGGPPNNYLVPSILATIFCCLPAGVVGIVFAAQVNSKWQAGDYVGAQDAADKAKQWTYISVGIGVVVLVLYILLVILASAGSS